MPELGAILTAIVTPFDDRLEINEEAFVRLLHHVVDHGSDGVVAAATTGEAPTLTDEEQLRVIELAIQEIGDRATVVAGTGSNETRIDKIARIIRESRLSVHDISRVELDAASDLPRFNMPFECGLAMGAPSDTAGRLEGTSCSWRPSRIRTR